MLVLLATAWPLHRSPEFSNWQTVDFRGPAPLHAGSDEYGLIVWTADDQGKITLRSAADGKVIHEIPAPADSVTADASAADAPLEDAQPND